MVSQTKYISQYANSLLKSNKNHLKLKIDCNFSQMEYVDMFTCSKNRNGWSLHCFEWFHTMFDPEFESRISYWQSSHPFGYHLENCWISIELSFINVQLYNFSTYQSILSIRKLKHECVIASSLKTTKSGATISHIPYQIKNIIIAFDDKDIFHFL